MRQLHFNGRQFAGFAGVALFFGLLWILLPVFRGWGGAGDNPSNQAAKQNEEEKPKEPDKPKPKPDFEKLKITALPHDGQDLTQSLKPGHWASATIEAKANNFDFSGELEAGVTSNNRPVDLEHTAYRLLSTRPAGLPKGQGKRLELLFYPPRSLTTNLSVGLYGRGGGEALRDSQPFSHLPAYQYFMYVLSSQPGRYAYLRVLDTVKPPWDDLAEKERDEYYRVLFPQVGQNVGLPSHPLVWSSIAVLVWDDIHPKVLHADQQQALLDWLHWGGQILISGPRTLDLLRDSFLNDYLPADGAESITLDEAALAELNRNWTVQTTRSVPMPLSVTGAWPAVRLNKRETGSFIPGTGELVVERRVGRGRIVVSAFRLTERDLTSWRSFDSFVNNALLRRPSRAYSSGELADSVIDWVQWLPAAKNATQRPYRILRDARFDPGLVTNVRYFSRDGGNADVRSKLAEAAGLPADIQENLNQYAAMMPGMLDTAQYEESRRIAASAHNPGVGGWSDFSPVAQAARESLRDAAGIVIPNRSFVVWVIGLYLLVIVPLNWLVFWALGRVEWAWIAAPVIAVACAFAVIRMARLDIGFVRSKSEIAIVELQGQYPRAHVTRFSALYTSLSTGYDVRFENPSALAAPFSTNPAFRLLTGEEATPVMYRRDSEVRLTGYQVSSNSTGMLHTESMHELGPILLSDARGLWVVANNTSLALKGAAVLRCNPGGAEYAWLGALRPREEMTLNFKPLPSSGIAERQQATVSAAQAPVRQISLRALIEIAEARDSLNPGDVRLVAWTEDEVPGIEFQPRSQQRQATLVVANLRTGLGEKPERDVNTRAEIAPPASDEEEFDTFGPLPDGGE